MTATAIFLLTFGLPLLFGGLFWLMMKAGWMRDDLPPGEKDAVQRYGPPIFLLIIGALLFAFAGMPGLVAGIIVVLLFSLIGALIVTPLQARRHHYSEQPLPPFHRRFIRNFWSGLKEFPFYLPLVP